MNAISSLTAPVVIGGDEHKRLFCRMLLDSFNPYKPAVIAWPTLDEPALARLTALPIWDIAVRTEGWASQRVNAYAAVVSDPLLRQAIQLNGFEESRHKMVLSNLVAAYGIDLAPEPAYAVPRHVEWAFMVTGYSECIDSFFAFGLFELARRSGFFPPQLVDTFEPVIHEESRHITFFVNWAAWHRRNLAWWRRPLFDAKRLAVWGFLIWERLALARNFGGRGEHGNFTVTGSAAVGGDIGPVALMELCLAENDRRLAALDPRLLRPNFVPAVVRLVRRLLAREGKARQTAVE
jgi:hypothetical protein